MPQETKSMPAEITEAPSPAGWDVELGDDARTMDVLEKAFDFRGDVTLTLKDGRTVGGYIFDRRKGKALADSTVRLMGAASDEKISVSYAQVRRITFSDRDPAAGKSFETWMKKYVEKKLKGEAANIESESLD